MKDEIFIDSNILIYSVSQNLSKCQTSSDLGRDNKGPLTELYSLDKGL